MRKGQWGQWSWKDEMMEKRERTWKGWAEDISPEQNLTFFVHSEGIKHTLSLLNMCILLEYIIEYYKNIIYKYIL